MARITVDPITRIEGHLRIDVEVDGGAVRDSWSRRKSARISAMARPVRKLDVRVDHTCSRAVFSSSSLRANSQARLSASESCRATLVPTRAIQASRSTEPSGL